MEIPEYGFMRLRDVLHIIPVSKTTWYEGVKSGRFPKGIKISENVVAWKVDDIKQLVKRIEEQAESRVGGGCF